MTIEEAYRKGQYDMRKQIMKFWAYWSTEGLGGRWRAYGRPGRKGYADVAVLTRKNCKVRSLGKPVEKPIEAQAEGQGAQMQEAKTPR